ncbi:MAG: hypothetical protein M0Z52_05595 [Actinomycetota bacterium]|nr:hypothetical protein [Actinomycetota bacterium]
MVGPLSPQIVQALINAGGGLLIALVILFGLYRLANRFGGRFIAAQQAQAEALGAQAQSLARQAVSMEDLKECINSLISRDNSEHREMLVLLKYIAQQHRDLTARKFCESLHSKGE